ncbi:hypothetical protein F4V43_18615 [Paenibacillus spiritus]|uniref:Uncharacterized protein n=1 Tax=Paenibacillus spiritus TaxID=2496557 RepID=A0A5J5FT65_9BACL|nr:hypothetical protein [Paenibacillus spiritus]KAA8996324.1 hypothetical protein F4V43_18615 [Paenibacillus spiritus]
MTTDATPVLEETLQESFQKLCKQINELTLKREIYNNVIDMVIQFSQDNADTDQKMLILYDLALDINDKLYNIEGSLIMEKFKRGRMINQHRESITLDTGN